MAKSPSTTRTSTARRRSRSSSGRNAWRSTRAAPRAIRRACARRTACWRILSGHRATAVEHVEYLCTDAGHCSGFETWSFPEDREGLMRDLVHAPVKRRVLFPNTTHFMLFEKHWMEFFEAILKF